jgi:hypothetical protein
MRQGRAPAPEVVEVARASCGGGVHDGSLLALQVRAAEETLGVLVGDERDVSTVPAELAAGRVVAASA